MDSKHHPFRSWGLAAISALATILVAAAVDPGRNWVRLRALPGDQRQKLVETLKKFDLLYTSEQQKGLLELDRRINELEPAKQVEYFAVLRRYHNWLNRLPEKKQNEVREAPPGERLSLVKKLVAEYPVPRMTTGPLRQFTDLGDYSPFELAALVKTWLVLKPAQQRRIEKLPVLQKRHETLFEAGAEQKIPREIRPPEFDDKHWAGQFEKFAAKKPALQLNEVKKKQESLHAEIRRRQAINYYFLRNPPHAVAPERLADFLAGFPPWLQSDFDTYPPDEARRRLTIVYRLVFPFPAEMAAAQRAPAPQAGARSGPNPGRGPSSPADKAPDTPGRSPY